MTTCHSLTTTMATVLHSQSKSRMSLYLSVNDKLIEISFMLLEKYKHICNLRVSLITCHFLQEIEEHVVENGEIDFLIKDLVKEVEGLQFDPKTDVRRQMFPHLYREIPK